MCDNFRILRIFYLVKTLISIIQICIPIILIIMSTIDLTKYLTTGKNDKKIVSTVIKRFLYAVIIFFVPSIINFSLNLLSYSNDNLNACLNNSNKEYIEALEKVEKEKNEALKKARDEEKKKRIEENKKRAKELEEARKEREKRRKSGNALAADSDCTDPATDGRVYVKNGTFYIPGVRQSGTQGTQGSGANGLNTCFSSSLEKLLADARSNGHTVTVSSGWRSFSAQQATFERNGRNPKWAATPGGSRHGWGIAADLRYSSGAARNWIHSNCKRYGLWFRMPYENWHIEPMALQTY